MKHKITYRFLILYYALGWSSTSFSQMPPIANYDIINVLAGKFTIKNVCTNDSNWNYLDTVIYTTGKGQLIRLGSTVLVKYIADSSFFGIDTGRYVVCNAYGCDTGNIYILVDYVLYPKYAELDINNIRAGFKSEGSLFNNLASYPQFEVPKGKGSHTIFSVGLWIGGRVQNSTLFLAANYYSHDSIRDFYPGPVMNQLFYTSTQDSFWNKLWKVNRSDINYHIANWSNSNYVPPVVFKTWPAHGDTTKMQSYYLAPFYDNNGDGKYNPYNGDYPLIRGDQAVYFIFNDDRGAHTQSGSNKMKAEVHGMAYSFNCPSDSALWNTLFLNYRIINRSNNTYDSTYIGMFVDGDLGCYQDDYIASDVQRGSYYFYNGDGNDEDCSLGTGYGSYVPAQSITLLAGPAQDVDGYDNPLTNSCDSAVLNKGVPYAGLGVGYGDGTPDNERLGLTHFMSFYNVGGGDPVTGPNFYNYMRGYWKDNTHCIYGGNGNMYGCPGSGPGSAGFTCSPTNYMLPDSTDPLGWGTGCVPQSTWNEVNSGNTPADRQGVGSSGPFTFKPGEVQELDLAFVFGRDYTKPNDEHAGVVIMKQRIDAVRTMFVNDSTPCGKFVSVSLPSQEQSEMIIYPNPATDELFVNFTGIDNNANYTVYDITGRIILKGTANSIPLRIDLQGFQKGIYLLQITDGKKTGRKRFVTIL